MSATDPAYYSSPPARRSQLRVGVVLCTYNGERYLRAQVESIFRQTRTPDICLVYDDGSSDGTLRELETLAVDAPFPFYIRRNAVNLGYVRNFEQAIAACDTDVVALSDQDDYWKPEKLATLEAFFLSDPDVSGVFSDAAIVDEDLQTLGSTLLDAVRATVADRSAAQEGNLLPVLLRRNVVSGATLAFRVTSKSKILPIPEPAIHDEWIALVCAAHGRVRLISDPLIFYRQHSANQIGLLHLAWRRRLDTLIYRHGPEARRRLKVMICLRERLVSTNAPAEAIQRVEAAIGHLERRLSLSKGPFKRMGEVVREATSGAYSRYSAGLSSAVRDLVLPL